jgi:hypothetical protein
MALLPTSSLTPYPMFLSKGPPKLLSENHQPSHLLKSGCFFSSCTGKSPINTDLTVGMAAYQPHGPVSQAATTPGVGTVLCFSVWGHDLPVICCDLLICWSDLLVLSFDLPSFQVWFANPCLFQRLGLYV